MDPNHLSRAKSVGDAQARESAEPHERTQPMPVLAVVITSAVVLAGASYLVLSEPFGDARWGDRRTVSDLSVGPLAAAGNAGAKLDGKSVFTSHCAACHQSTGKGVPGVFPPLDGSEWVSGQERVLINILLYGISGEMQVSGVTYKGVMPAFGHLSDAELAAVASYVRGQWSNKETSIETQAIASERSKASRATPFMGGEELKKLLSTP